MRNRWFGIVAALAMVACCASFAYAHSPLIIDSSSDATQTVADKSEEEKVFASFDTGLNALSQRFQTTLIVEDKVFLPHLPDDKVQLLLKEMNSGKQDAATVFRTFALYYDFDAVRYRNHCYLLTKRFTADADLACVTLPEWHDAVKAVTQIISDVTPLPERSPFVPFSQYLMSSMNEAQIEALKSENGLSVSLLTEDQKAAVHKIGLYFYLQAPLSRISGREKEIAVTLDDQTRFGWFDYEMGKKPSVRVFGYAASLNKPGKRDIYPLTLHNFARMDSNGNAISWNIVGNANEAGPTAPTVASNDKSDISTDNSITLGQIVEELNGKQDASTKTFEVAPMLAEKRVTLSGNQYSTPDILIGGIAELYGVRVRFDSAKNHSTIERFRLRVDNKLENVRYAVLSALPVPFLRSIHMAPDGTSLVTIRNGMEPDKDKIKLSDITSRSDDVWRTAAIKQLRTVVQPILTKNNQSDLPGKDLPKSAGYALANIFMTDAAGPLLQLVVAPVPLYLDQPDKIVFKGGPYKGADGSDWFGLGAHTPRTNGTFEPFFGLSNRITPLTAAH